MTLSKGNHVVKLDEKGQPLTTEREVYIEYEIEELASYTGADGEYRCFALLRKIR